MRGTKKNKSSSEAEQYWSLNCPHLDLFCSFIVYKTNNENEVFALEPPHAWRSVTLQTTSVCKAQESASHTAPGLSVTVGPSWDSSCSPCPLSQGTELKKRNQVSVSVCFAIRDGFWTVSKVWNIWYFKDITTSYFTFYNPQYVFPVSSSHPHSMKLGNFLYRNRRCARSEALKEKTPKSWYFLLFLISIL